MHTEATSPLSTAQPLPTLASFWNHQTMRGQEVRRLSSLGYIIMPVWGLLSDGSCMCSFGASCDKAGKHTYSRGGRAKPLASYEDVDALWSELPGLNFGILHGVHHHAEFVSVCLDFDLYKDEKAFQNFENKFGHLPETAFHRSARGGLHLFYKVRRTVFSDFIDGVTEGKRQIFQRAHGIEHVDFLYGSGRNAYSIGPGSVRRSSDEAIGFQYYSADQNYGLGPVESLTDLPATIIEDVLRYLSLKDQKQEEVFTTPRPVCPEDINGIPLKVRWILAEKWLHFGKRSLSIQGYGGNKAMLDAMGVLTRGFGIDPQMAMPLMAEWNRLYSRPPWSDFELQKAAERSWRGISGRNIGFMLESATWFERAEAVRDALAAQVEIFPRRKKHNLADNISWAFMKLLSEKRLTSESLSHLPAKSREKVLKGLREELQRRNIPLKATRWGNSYIWSIP